MAYILEKIGNTYNLPKKYFTCDAKSDLDGISLVDVPIGSEAYCILEEESYILDSNKQWHKKKIGEDLTGQVQADLSQTDSAQTDYVKGVLRTEHLPEGYPYKEQSIIEWNGNIEGLSTINNMLYKVSDTVFDSLIGYQYQFNLNSEQLSGTITTIQYDAGIPFYTAEISGSTIPVAAVVPEGHSDGYAAGLYFTRISETIFTCALNSETIHTIAQEFLPLTFDSTPTANSTNPVTSSGIKDALDEKMMLVAIKVQLPSPVSWESVTYGNGKFVAVTDNSNQSAYSEDGINWTSSTMPTSAYWPSVTYGNGKFVAVARNSNQAAYSEDGINWTSSTMPTSTHWSSVTYGNGKFVVIAWDSDQSAYSEDGINWTSSTMPGSNQWLSVTYGNGKFVAIAMNSTQAAYSEDGVNWTASTMPSSASWESVTYGNGKFVAIAGNSNQSAYSEDGINWTSSTMPSSVKWYFITYGNGKFVAIATDSNQLAYSEDGINWTASTMPDSNIWSSVTYGNDKFVAVARFSDQLAYSKDGITWKNSIEYLSQNNSNITESVRSVIGIPSYTTANNGQFLRVINGIPTWTESLPTLTSPNGTKYQLTVSDDGTLSAVVVS